MTMDYQAERSPEAFDIGASAPRPQAELIDRIQARCIARGSCLVWLGADGQPDLARVKRGGPLIRWDGQVLYVRQVWWSATNAMPIPAGLVLLRMAECADPGCICHFALGTRAEQNRRTVAAGGLSDPLRRQRIAVTMRERHGRITPGDAELICNGARPAAQYAREMRISKGGAALIRRGLAWQQFDSPRSPNYFAGLGTRTPAAPQDMKLPNRPVQLIVPALGQDPARTAARADKGTA